MNPPSVPFLLDTVVDPRRRDTKNYSFLVLFSGNKEDEEDI